MRLAHSLHKKVLEVNVGHLLNKFKLRKRRDVLFFERIFADYVKLCEEKGYAKEMRKLGYDWVFIVNSVIWPSVLKKMPASMKFKVFSMVWKNLGSIKELNYSQEGDKVKIFVEKGGITRLVEENEFSFGVFGGAVSFVFNKEIEFVSCKQSKEKAEYEYRLLDKTPVLQARTKEYYDKMNAMKPIKGFTLQEALKNKFLYLKDNVPYFRGESLVPVEGTIFHLTGARGILLDEVPGISYNFFKKVVREGSDVDRYNLLKHLLQVMGWGIVRVFVEGRVTKVELVNPPYGLQKEEDNWEFIAKVILGFLKVIDDKFRLTRVKEGYKRVTMKFER